MGTCVVLVGLKGSAIGQYINSGVQLYEERNLWSIDGCDMLDL